MEDVKRRKLRAIEESNPDVVRAYAWLESNRHLFKKPVYGPVCLEVNVENALYAKYLVTMLPGWLMTVLKYLISISISFFASF
jgi:hypothetical protein